MPFKEIIKNRNKNEKTTYKNNQTKHRQMLLEQRNHSSTAKKLLIGSNYMTQYRTWSRSKVQTPKVFPFPSRKDPLKKNKKYVQEMSKKLSIKQYLLLGGTRI